MNRKALFYVFSVGLLIILSTGAYSQLGFNDIGESTSSNQLSNSEWGDYDNDGDLDILFDNSATKVWKNDGDNKFSIVNIGIVYVGSGHRTWSDYDNDGDLDVAVTGSYGSERITRIYRNDGSNVFTNINAGLIGVSNSCCAWGDYNNDGRPDLVTSGLNAELEPIAVLYRNDGSDNFTDSNIDITPCVDGKLEWGDYNNDEYLDLLISGQDYNGNNVADIYKNNGKGQFIPVNAGFDGDFRGDIGFGDYDGDGDLDVAICGQNRPVRIFRNDGSDVFSSISIDYLRMQYSSLDWGDFDSDGDLDLLVGGLKTNPPSLDFSCIYENQGSDVFVKIDFPIGGVNRGSVAWGDYDNDNDLDIVASGISSSTRIYRNDRIDLNTLPGQPANVKSLVVNDGAILSWNPAADNETPSASLTYNIRIGTTPGGEDILSSMSNLANGRRELAESGNAGLDTDYYIKNLPLGNYHWSVQSVDGSFKGSTFTTEQTFEIKPSFEALSQVFPQSQYSGALWGDYNNDGFMDLVYCGDDQGALGMFTKLYKNNGDYTFDTVNVSFPGIINGRMAWGDYDNDADLDLLLCGVQGSYGAYTPLVKLYRNDGSDIFTDIDIGVVDINQGKSKWADHDNDGDLDIIIVGASNSTIFRNDGGDQFTNINAGLQNSVNSYGGSLSIGDYDNDLDLDLMIAGSGNTQILSNEGNGHFINSGIYLPSTGDGNVTFGEFDNDGDLDILHAGTANSLNAVLILRNDSGVFNDIEAGIRGVQEATGEWGDFNNDGFSDVLYTGRNSGTNFISKIYLNEQNSEFTGLKADLEGGYRSRVSRADIDNDGDLDVFISDYSNPSILYLNNLNFPESMPQAPFDLQTENFGKGVILSWARPSGSPEGELGLSYNIRLGTSPGSADVISPMTLTPLKEDRLLHQRGNADLNTSWRLDSLAVGDYYWSVQAITSSFRGGKWSDEGTFTMTALRPFFSSDIVCLGDETSFADETVVTGTSISSWLWEFGDGNSSTMQHPQHVYDLPGSYTATLTVSDAEGVSLDKTNSVYVLPKPLASFSVSDICIGSLASTINTSETDTLTITSWFWDYGDGGTSLLQNPGPHPYLIANGYDIKLQINAQNGCSDSVSNHIEVAEYPLSNIAVGGNPEFCEGGEVKLSVPQNSNYIYQWKIGGGNIAGEDSSVFYANRTGNYIVGVTNLTAACYSESLSPVSVVVAETPPQLLIEARGEIEFCDGEDVELTVAYNADYSYQWRRNEGAVGSNSNTYLATADGNYTVDITNSTGCKDTSANSIIITVYESPSSPSLNLSGASTFCEGDSLILSVADPGTDNYQWMNEFGTIKEETGTSLTIKESGQYKVRVRNIGLCESFSQEKDVVVNAYPIVPVILTDNYTEDACQSEDPIVLSVASAEDDLAYQWSKDGDVINEANGPGYSGYLEEGSYKVKATRITCSKESLPLSIQYAEMPDKPEIVAEGPMIWYLACSNDSATEYKWYLNGVLIQGAIDYLYVAGTQEGKFEVAISKDGSCFAKSDPLWIPLGTGIDVDPWENLKIYPNPTPGLFTLEMDNHLMGELIIDIFGESGAQIININFHKETAHFKTQIDLSAQPSAAYLIGLMLDKYRTNRTLIVE